MNPEIFAKELAKYGFELNEKQKKQFATYYDKLVEFNKKVNLTRITDKNEVYLKHFFDSITPLLEFPNQIFRVNLYFDRHLPHGYELK